MSLKKYPCPECQSEMESGFVTSNHSIRWAQNESEGSFFGIRAETLTPRSILRLRNPKCHALRCRKCGIVIFEEWHK